MGTPQALGDAPTLPGFTLTLKAITQTQLVNYEI